MRIIPRDIKERINLDALRPFLKSCGISVSGLKSELFDKLEEAIEDGNLPVVELDRFIVNEIAYGRNRLLYISSFPESQVESLKDLSKVKVKLSSNGFETENFNMLRRIVRPEEINMSYMDIDQQHGAVNKISMCFAKTIMVRNTDSEGEALPQSEETYYIWVDIIPDQEKIIVKTYPRYDNNRDSSLFKTKDIHTEVETIVRGVFSLAPVKQNIKNVLYNLFRDMTRKAEEPYRKKIMVLKEDIDLFAKECACKLGLPDANYSIDMPLRLHRLFERALIQNDFDNYLSYFEGKKGIIERFDYSDPTGAKVYARSRQEEGIGVADIYFDTKETIEIQKQLEKLWVTWFYVDPETNKPIQVRTKFEVFNNYFTIHFLNAYTFEGVENFVLSCFREYE